MKPYLKTRLLALSVLLTLQTTQAAAGFYLVAPLKAASAPTTDPVNPPDSPFADIVATPGAIEFSRIQQGDATVPIKVSLRNPGDSAQYLGNVQWADAGPFSAMLPCTTIAAGESCDGYVYLDNTVPAGSYQNRLVIAHQGPSGSLTIPVQAAMASPAGSLPSSVDFGSVPVGSATDGSVTVSNTGIGRLTLTPPNASSITGDGFTFLGTDCMTALPVGGSCNINVRLTGTKAGNQVGSATLATGAGLLTAELKGEGQRSDLVFSSGPVPGFGRINVGDTATSGLITLKNNGNLPATGLAIETTNNRFTLIESACSTQLVAGASCSLKVQFDPETTGAQSGALQVRSDGNLVAMSPLSGTGASSPLLMVPATYGYNVTVGATQTMSVAVTNTGTAAVALQGMDASVSLPGLAIAPTTGAGSCGTQLSGSSTCKYYFKLDSTASTGTGRITFSLSTSNGVFTDTSVTMVGSWATLSATPSTAISFGSVILGESPTSAVISIKNNGSNVTNSALTYALPAGFTVVNNNCGSVSVRQTTCQLQIQFLPTQEKAYSGNVLLTTKTGTGTPYTLSIPVTGTGTAPASLSWTGGELATVEVGAKKQTALSVYNPGPGPMTVGGVALTGNTTEFRIASQACAASLAAKSLCTVHVEFAPTDTGVRTPAVLTAQANGISVSKQINGTGGQAVFQSNLARLSYPTLFTSQPGIQDAFHDLQIGITNNGNTAAEDLKTEILFDGQPQGFSFQYNACVTRLNVGATCTTKVRGIGGTPGTHTGVVRISSRESRIDIPFSITLVKPDLTFTATVPLKDTAVGTATTATYTVQGRSMGRFTVTLPQITGNAEEYSIASGTTCTNVSTPSNGSCVVKVLFTPAGKGPRPAATLTSVIGGETRSLTLQASGL